MWVPMMDLRTEMNYFIELVRLEFGVRQIDNESNGPSH